MSHNVHAYAHSWRSAPSGRYGPLGLSPFEAITEDGAMLVSLTNRKTAVPFHWPKYVAPLPHCDRKTCTRATS